MVVYRGIEVTVQADGQDLKEYDHDEDEVTTPNVITKYIQVISDAKFAISIKLLDDFKFASDALIPSVYVDGVCVVRRLFQRRISVLLKGHEEKQGDQRYLRPFYFADLPSREHIYLDHVVLAKVIITVDPLEQAKAEVEQFCNVQMQGIISVRAYDVKVLGPGHEAEHRGCALDNGQEIGEKARVKTGVTHRSK